MTKNKGFVWVPVAAGLALAVSLISLWVVKGPSFGTATTATGPYIENYVPAIMYSNGYNSAKDIATTGNINGADGTFSGALAVTGAGTFTSTLAANGVLTINAGILDSYALSTSTTGTAVTLKQSDILSYTTVLMTPNTSSLTVTFPASSTLTSLVPTAGDVARQCWFDATTTAAATIVFAAGTGIDLEVATSSSISGVADLTLTGNNMGCLTYLRKANTDIVVGYSEFSDAD